MPALGGPGPRRVNAGAVKRRQRNLAKLPKAAPKHAAVYVAPARAYKPTPAPARRAAPTPAPAPTPTPKQLQAARAQERSYASQGKAIQHAATEQRTASYLSKPVKQRRAEVREIKATPVKDRTSGEQRILDVHGKRQGVDVRTRKEVGFLPRAQYGTQKALPTNVMPKPAKAVTIADVGEKAPPKLRAALATNPKLKAQAAGMLHHGQTPQAVVGALKEQKAQRAATVEAPVLKAIDLPMRPGYASLESMRKDIEQGGVGELFKVAAPGSKTAKRRRAAMKRGITGKARTTGSDVLAQAGVKNPIVKAVGGLTLDVTANPLSYAQGGAGTVAERAGMLAGRKVARGAAVRGERAAARAAQEAPKVAADAAKRAARKGATPEEAAKVGDLAGETHVRSARAHATEQVTGRARRAAEQAAPRGKGVTVRFAGTEVPGVRRGTAFAGRHTAKAIPKPVKRAARSVARTLRPTIRAEGYSAEQFEDGLRATAGARASASHAEQRALTLARELKANIPPEDYQNVVSALERDRLGKLPDEYRRHVHDLRSALREAFRHGRRAGVIKGEVGDFGNWLKQGELRKLLKTIESETGAQTRRVGQAGVRLERAGSRVKIAETEAVGRQRTGAVRATEQERRRAALTRQREIGSAGVAFERRRGGEALTGQRQLQSAERQLRTELAKPVAKRRGVAALEGRVQRLRQREPSDRLVAAEQRLQTARTPAAPVRQPVPSAPTGARVRSATAVHGERVQELGAQVARSRAAKDIPVKSRSETDQQYLTRVQAHARRHDLPLIEQRVAQLLKDKPQMTRGYFPREFDTRIQRRFGLVKPESQGRVTGQPVSQLKVSRVTAGHKRAEQRPLSQVNPERVKKGLEPHSTDIPSVTLNHIRDLGKSTSEAEWARKMGGLGREHKPPTLRPGETLEQLDARRAKAAEEFTNNLKDGEQVYWLGTKDGKYDLHPVSKVEAKAIKTRTSAQAQKKAKADPGWAARQALKPVKGRAAGRYVALNKQMVEELRGLAAPAGSNQYDQALGKWKSLAIGSPAFHIRNLIGDLHTASYEQPFLKVAGMATPMGSAGRTIRRQSALGRVVRPGEAGQVTKFQRGLRKVGLGAPGAHATIKVAGHRMPLDDFIKQAREDGMIDAGYVGAELHDLAASAQEVQAGAGKLKVTKPRGAARTLARWSRNRENTMRLATYKGMLDKGHSRAEARRIANELHIDYAHLSPLEKAAMRRVFPFYTWTARTLPLTAKKFVTRPGKFAAFESLLQESAKAAGLTPEQARAKMTAATQRQLPLTIKVPGVKDPVAVSWSDPMTLLGSLPTGKDFPAEARRLAVGMVTPAFKWSAEPLANRNLATMQDIEGKHLVTAPSEIVEAVERGMVPESIQRRLKIIPPKGSIPGKPNVGYVDFKTGKPAWGWRGGADYVHDQLLLGLGGQVAGLLGSGRSPTQGKGQAIAGLAGARTDVLDAKAAKYAQQAPLRKERDTLYSRRDTLHEGGIDAAHPNPEFKRIQKRINELNKTLSPRPAKKKKPAAGGFGGGGGFGKGFGGGKGFG